MKKVRTRFAPSPTGALHIGGVRTALYNYLFAKKHGGDFILRIEDTDTTRTVEGTEKYIIDSLKWCGIMPNEGVGCGKDDKHYRQSDRMRVGIYKPFVDELIAKGFAYIAFDTDADLNAMKEKMKASGIKNASYNAVTRLSMKNSLSLSQEEVKEKIERKEKYVVRFKIDKGHAITFNDLVKGAVTINTNELDDKILLKSDGMPTYHLANVVDDHLMGISHVIRGEEWLPSAPLHVLLYTAFGWEMPEFAHLPLLLAPDSSKLSKRKAKEYGFSVFPLTWTEKEEDGTLYTMNGYKENGYIPEALINFLALLGWSPGENKEIMSLDEMAHAFDFSRVSKSGAQFDLKKLINFNAIYFRKKDYKELATFIDTKGISYSGEKIALIIEAGIKRVEFSKDLNGIVSYFFEKPVINDMPTHLNPEFISVINKFINNVDNIDWTVEGIDKNIHGLIEAEGVKFGKVMSNLRSVLCGIKPGPDVPLIMFVLGKEECKERINLALRMNVLPNILPVETNSK